MGIRLWDEFMPPILFKALGEFLEKEPNILHIFHSSGLLRQVQLARRDTREDWAGSLGSETLEPERKQGGGGKTEGLGNRPKLYDGKGLIKHKMTREEDTGESA